jgi:hypothetical protein
MKQENNVNKTKVIVDCETDIGLAEYTVVLDKFAVDTFLFEHVQDNFNDILPLLLVGVEYTTEDLIGAALWTDLTCLAQRKAHLCLKHLATMPGTRLTDMANVSCNKTTFRID